MWHSMLLAFTANNRLEGGIDLVAEFSTSNFHPSLIFTSKDRFSWYSRPLAFITNIRLGPN